MRILFGTLVVLAAAVSLDAGGSSAQAAAWCAKYFGHGGTNCGFYTYAQCQVTVSGIGGYCELNTFPPRYYGEPRYYEEEPRRYRRYRR
jgi:hypothetical protein